MSKGIFVLAAIMAGSALSASAQTSPSQEPFRWGAASAAYQVEGAFNADNKGRSIWDVYLDDDHLAGPGISGDVAINFYDRQQYLKDIALLKKMGLNSYRFSISWPRIMPDGLGPVNPAAIAHYRQFITDLKDAGIKPMLTLYHWDMPASLAAAGGWENRASIDWFQRYAEVVFANFADQVDLFVLVNEPSIERDLKTAAEEKVAGGKGSLVLLPNLTHLAVSLKTYNHILLASAGAKKSFDAKGYKGKVGLAIPLFPPLTAANPSASDTAAAKFGDGVLNRWFLDAMFKGTYPEDILAFAKERKLDTDVKPEDAATIHAAHFDFLGINYYAPVFFRHPKEAQDPAAAEAFTPDGIDKAFNGAVRPDMFKALLDRIRTEYGNPTVYITENGAGFPGEDKLVDGTVHDVRRCRYIVQHVAAMQQAIAAGADVRGYHVWSSHDNLEWISGYGSRFGLIYVDFDTQQRTPKMSAGIYARITRGENLSPDVCGK
jgi:beta-glucosidase